MKRSLSILLAVALFGAFAVAAPKHKTSKAATCSVCKMTLSSKRDKTHTVAVKVKGKTMYCCSACDMNKKK